MRKQICDFAKLKGLAVCANRKMSKISCYVILDMDGGYHGIDAVDKKLGLIKLIPDIAIFAATSSRGNAMVDKRCVLFDVSAKHDGYIAGLRMGADMNSVSCHAMTVFFTHYADDEEFAAQVLNDLDEYGIKDKDVVSFKIEDECVEDMEYDWNDWLVSYVASLKSGRSEAPLIVSSISGELQESVPEKAGPCIKNVPNDAKAVFGLGRPCYFTAAKFPSYQSYGFSGGSGLQVGADDGALLAAGMEFLLSNPEYRNKDFQLVYFYDKEVDNIISESLNGDIDMDKLMELDDDVEAHKSVLSQILSAVMTGERPFVESDGAMYYMTRFSMPSDGRCYFSNEVYGSYADLVGNLYEWYSDTCIDTGSRMSCVTKFYNVLLNCVSNPKLPYKKLCEGVDKEFSVVKTELLNAIYQHRQIPFVLYDRALRHVDTGLTCGDDKFKFTLYTQIIKCYLLRKGYVIMPAMSNDVSPAYACGKLFAVYEQMQWLYNRKDLNKNLAQSHFSAAMKQPSVVFPQLASMAVVYFNGLQGGSRVYYTDLIGEISSEIGMTFPSRFDDDNKGAFVLGYYQQRAAFRKFYTADKQSDVQADTNISSEVKDYE